MPVRSPIVVLVQLVAPMVAGCISNHTLTIVAGYVTETRSG